MVPSIGPLATHEDVFADYSLDGFPAAFEHLFEIAEEAPVTGTSRVLLRMTRRRT